MERNQVAEAKKKEAYIVAELYRLVKNAISHALVYQETKCEFSEVIPEFPVAERRADLVVFASRYGRTPEPFLVVETKVRAYSRPGPSAAAATRSARAYAQKLNMLPSHFFATYDAWNLLVFRDIPPYLIGAFGPISNEHQIRNLLMGLEEYYYKGKSDLLNNLPTPADPEFLVRRVLPSVAGAFTKEPEDKQRLIDSWKRMLLSQ